MILYSSFNIFLALLFNQAAIIESYNFDSICFFENCLKKIELKLILNLYGKLVLLSVGWSVSLSVIIEVSVTEIIIDIEDF